MSEPPADPHVQDLVSLNEAADILGLHRAMAHRLVQQGALRGKKVGGTWVFRRAVVVKLKEQRGSVG